MPDQPTPLSGAGQPERRRPAPTIDLKATEIAGDAGSGAEPPQPQSSEQMESPPNAAQQPPEEKAADNKGSRPRPARAGALWLPLGGAIAGALLTGAIVALALPALDRDRGVALESRVAQLERQLAEFAGRPPASDAELAGRLQKLEAQVAAQGTAPSPAADPALANRLAEIEAELHSLRAMVEAASSRSEDVAAGLADARRGAEANAAALAELAQQSARSEAGATNDLAGRLSALADRVGALEARPQGGDDPLARTAVIAGALAGAVERGAPFAAELRAAQGQGDPKLLAALEPFAASGLPSPPALARELSALKPQLLAAAGAPSGGFLQKLAVHAENLVRIWGTDEAQAGDAPAAVIARAELKAAHDDLSGALAELARLPDSVRAPAQAWIARTEARNAALTASRSFAAQAFAALGKAAR